MGLMLIQPVRKQAKVFASFFKKKRFLVSLQYSCNPAFWQNRR